MLENGVWSDFWVNARFLVSATPSLCDSVNTACTGVSSETAYINGWGTPYQGGYQATRLNQYTSDYFGAVVIVLVRGYNAWDDSARAKD